MTYNTNKNIPTLNNIRRMEREKKENELNIEAKNFLLKANSYYNDSYPHSTHENIWEKTKIKIVFGNETLENELKILKEEELHALYDILRYFHDERQMPKIKDHNLHGRILGMVRKLTPGATFLDKLYHLYTERQAVNKEIKELEDKLDIERKEFIKRLENNKTEKPEHFPCELCTKVCRSPAGLKSHMRIHNED